MKRFYTICLYLILTTVIVSEFRTVWIAHTDMLRFRRFFPAADETMYYVAFLTSACAGANAIAVWLRQKWAVWLNVAIGIWSILLVWILRGPLSIQIIILAATSGILFLSLLLPERFNKTV